MARRLLDPRGMTTRLLSIFALATSGCLPDEPSERTSSDADGDSDADSDSDSDAEPWCPNAAELWGSGTLGSAGVAEFFLWSCPLGCGFDRPLASGTTEPIAVDAPVSGTVFESSDTNVLSLGGREDCPGRDDLAMATGEAAGDVELVLRDAAGEEVDRVAWSVRDAETLVVLAEDGSELPDAPVQVALGDFVLVAAELRDASGAPLYASESVHWTLPDTQFAAIGIEPDADVHYSLVNVIGNAVGTTTLSVEALGLSAQIAIEVVAG
jgi:hypothetical protein